MDQFVKTRTIVDIQKFLYPSFETDSIKVDQFLKARTKVDIQSILYPISSYFFFDIVYNTDNPYSIKEILKRNGKIRKIAEPKEELKEIQRALLEYLYLIYNKFYGEKRKCAHGFLKKKSIFTNAEAHARKRFVLNFDLKDFFPSINFGRVRGLFIAPPYNMPKDCATILAQLICYKNSLPQGGVTSPIVSNMICAKLDGELQKLAIASRCGYTRYADDITISTNLKTFPLAEGIGRSAKLAKEIVEIIENNGFHINEGKTILQPYFKSQKVTGLKVNKFINVDRTYIRSIRGMLYVWRKYGLEEASKNYFNKYSSNRHKYKLENIEKSFKKVLRGKIQHVINTRSIQRDKKKPDETGKLDKLSEKLYENYHINSMINSTSKIMIIGEGRTDRLHMKKAFKILKENGDFQNLELDFCNKNKTQKRYPTFEGSTLFKVWDKVKLYNRIYGRAVFISDVDKEGKDNQWKSKEDVMKSDNNKNIFFIKLPKDCCKDKNSFAIEDLYSEEIQQKHNFKDKKNKQDKISDKSHKTTVKMDFAKSIYEKEDRPSAFKNFCPLFKKIEELYK